MIERSASPTPKFTLASLPTTLLPFDTPTPHPTLNYHHVSSERILLLWKGRDLGRWRTCRRCAMPLSCKRISFSSIWYIELTRFCLLDLPKAPLSQLLQRPILDRRHHDHQGRAQSLSRPFFPAFFRIVSSTHIALFQQVFDDKSSDSGKSVFRYFCGDCVGSLPSPLLRLVSIADPDSQAIGVQPSSQQASALYSAPQAMPGVAFVKVGCVSLSSALEPSQFAS